MLEVVNKHVLEDKIKTACIEKIDKIKSYYLSKLK